MRVIIFILCSIGSLQMGLGQSAVHRLSSKLTQDQKTTYDQVRNIYNWVTSHIKYDIRQLKDIKDFQRAQSPAIVLQNKIAVCQGYANLMKALLDEADITNYVIIGDARTEDDDNLQRHSWNAILIDHRWHLVDATWDAGYIRDRSFVRRQTTDFFLQKPEVFIRTHLPDDPIWQLLPVPISLAQFDQKYYPDSSMTSKHTHDSLWSFLALPLQDQSLAAARRQIAYNPDNIIGYYDLAMSYFDQANDLGKSYEKQTANFKTRSDWIKHKATLTKLLTEQEDLIRAAFVNFEVLEQMSPEYRVTAQKNMSILKSVLRIIKNERRLINDF